MASFVIVVAGMRAASSVILPVLSAVFLALITLPLLNWLRARRVPMPLAVVLTLLAAFLVLTAFAVLIGGSVSSFTDQVPKYKERLNEMTVGVQDQLQRWGIDVSQISAFDVVQPGRALDVATGTLRGVAAVVSNSFLVFLIIVFILFEAAGFPHKLKAAFGERSVSGRYDRIRDEIQKYLGIKTLVSLATGSLVAAGLAIMRVDYPLLWGMLAFLLNYIPNLGSILAAVPPVLLAIVQFGPGRAIAVAALFLTINIVMGNFIEPTFMGRRLGLSTLVVFMSLVFWGWVWGPVGMLLSVPLTMIVKITLEQSDDMRWLAILLGPADPNPD
jgi:predicted PurR-regulated permease PerM